MLPDHLEATAIAAIKEGARISLVVPRPWRNRPRGFPHGELLCENSSGQNVYSFDPVKILQWLHQNELSQTQED